jgi:hypothetical protein
MNETVEIYLNSKSARMVGTNTSDCYFDINIIDISEDETAYVSLKNIVVPYSWYNVNSSNNTLIYELSVLLTNTITIPVGNYNVTTLAAELTSQLAPLSPTITYNSKSGRFHFQFSKSTVFKNESTCFELLGLTQQDHYTDTNQISSNISCNMFTIRQLLLCSDNFILNNISASSMQSRNIISCIPVSGNPGSIIHYSNNSQHKIHHTNNLTSLHVQIKDDMNQLVNLNGIHWSATLAISIMKMK